MSAFLCNPHHIAALAWEFHKANIHADIGGSLDAWARALAYSNYKAIEERYGASEALGMAGGLYPHQYAQECADEARATRPQYSLVQLLKALDCYEYQASEFSRFRDLIPTNLNHGHTQALRGVLIQELSGYDAAMWELVA